jgi:hypothetical protein
MLESPNAVFASGSCRKLFARQTVTGANRMRYEDSLLILASIAAMICLFAVVVTYAE